jgi:hypothetical protein
MSHVKVQQSQNMPGQVMRSLGRLGSQNFCQQVVRLSALKTSRLYPQEFLLVLDFF